MGLCCFESRGKHVSENEAAPEINEKKHESEIKNSEKEINNKQKNDKENVIQKSIKENIGGKKDELNNDAIDENLGNELEGNNSIPPLIIVGGDENKITSDIILPSTSEDIRIVKNPFIKKNESNGNTEKIYTNEGNTAFIPKKLEEENNNNNNNLNDLKNDKGKSINIDNENNNYEKFDEKKEYYLICPECKENILNIQSIQYHSNKKDFIVTYRCFCTESSPKFFYQIISENQNYCQSHRSELISLCENCNTLACKECLKDHKEHRMKVIIDKEIISDEIQNEIIKKKEEFKGFHIVEKIFQLYQKGKYITEIRKHNGTNIFDSNKSKTCIIQRNQEQQNTELHNINQEERKITEENIPRINYINIKTFNAHNDKVSALTKLSNGFIASGSYDGTVKIWDITKDEKDAFIMQKNAIGSVFCLLEFEPGKLLGGTSANMINLWDLNDEKNDEFVDNFYQHLLWVNAIVKCDENHFASASNDSTIIIWNYKNKKNESILRGHTNCIMDMIILQNGHLCSAGADNIIIIWDWKNSRQLFYFKAHDKYVKCLCELSNKLLLTGSEDNTIGIWEEKTNSYGNISFLKGHDHPVRALCQIDDNCFASGGFDQKIKIWDLNIYECVQILEGHNYNILSLLKYNDDILISSSSDKSIKIWENRKK